MFVYLHWYKVERKVYVVDIGHAVYWSIHIDRCSSNVLEVKVCIGIAGHALIALCSNYFSHFVIDEIVE